ncbi:MAG TPA: hypothetical protein VJ813_19990 [Vicinamibacterales bacterium]|nr:hypothetical protein [Vicinamibacterales bacterium]
MGATMRLRPAGVSLLVMAVLVLGAAAPFQAALHDDPLAVFVPANRARIESGAVVVEVLTEHGDDFAVAGAVKTTADGRRLVAWSREIEALQRGKYVPLIQRFSAIPKAEDLSALVLDDDDLEDLRDCRPGRCGVKLASHEIRQISETIEAAGADWRTAAQQAFRAVVLARARAHLAGGYRAMATYDDQKRAANPSTEFARLLARCEPDSLAAPEVTRYFRAYPQADPQVESFLYWSKDVLGDAKPIISITHLAIFHGEPRGEPAIVAAAQVFASHYVQASLSLTSVVSRPGDDTRYLTYLRRSRVDVFQRSFGGLIRRMVQKRVRAEGPPVLDAFRRNLESGLRGAS